MPDDRSELEINEKSIENYLSASSEVMKEVVSEIRLYAPLDLPVVIEGESGTGKEMIAQSIHALSGREDAPFKVINMGEGPETLFESSLFGHCKGAFTGAEQSRIGYIGQAKNGTIFMDEINSLPVSLQPKLLRVLEYGTYWPVGSVKEEKTTARFVFSSNQSLEELKIHGHIREDIFYRLGRIIRIPPLRDRPEDIPLLVKKLVDGIIEKIKNKKSWTISPVLKAPEITLEAMKKIINYQWPGNIRQLKMVIERAVLVCKGNKIKPEDLDMPYKVKEVENFYAAMERFTNEYFSRIDKLAMGNIKLGMELTGMTETTYRRKMRRYQKSPNKELGD